jgi:hypothetical protein
MSTLDEFETKWAAIEKRRAAAIEAERLLDLADDLAPLMDRTAILLH